MKHKFEIGDKVWGNIGRDYPYATIVSLEYQEKRTRWYNGQINISFTDVELSFPGTDDTYRTKQEGLYLADERVLAINGEDKWTVNELLGEDCKYKVSMNNGYFGSYSLIEYMGKQAIVFVDDRNAKVKLITGFYDHIYYGNGGERWSGDYRWNSDRPVVVYDIDKGFNIVRAHTNFLLSEEWLDYLDIKFKDNGIGYYLNGTDKQGNAILLTNEGSIRMADETTPEALNSLLEAVKHYSIDDIQSKWLGSGKPCYYIRGLEYKGAAPRKVTTEKAAELFKTHYRFNGMFNSAEWRIIDSEVALLFRDYADSDYD